MNPVDENTIQVRGRIYHYDADSDIYYVRYTNNSFWHNYSWILVVVILALVCVYLEYA
jgi:hypothetical protein